MTTNKERYYASLEKQLRGEHAVKQQLSSEEPVGTQTEETMVYSSLGQAMISAVEGICHRLAQPSMVRFDGESPKVAEKLQQFMRSTEQTLEDISLTLRELSAAVQRIDRWTMEAYEQLHQFEQQIEEQTQREPEPKRLSRDETRTRALSAAKELRQQQENITLAKVARHANLKYGQIMYAFGNKDKFLDALEEEAAAS